MASRSGRLFFLDGFRVLAIVVVFLAHCGKIFDYHTQVMANAARSFGLSAFRDFSLLWVMPLFFVLSGGAIFLSRRSGGAASFIKSRFLRLVVPLLFVGTFLINPTYVYVERLSGGAVAASFLQWYPRYFEGFYGFGGNFAPLGNGTHLWYLEFLFVYSLLLYPWFARARRGQGRLLPRVSARLGSPIGLLLLFLPIAIVSALVEVAGLGSVRGMGGWDPVSYLLFLIYGYLLFSTPQALDVARRYGPAYLALAAALSLFFVGSHFGFLLEIPGLTRHDLVNDGALLPLDPSLWTAVQALRGAAAWCWVVGLIGLGRRLMNRGSDRLSYANEAVLPFYILHHAVIYVVGYRVVQSSLGVWSKFFLIAVISFAIIMAIYEILIRRINMLRFLFGMKLTRVYY